MNYYVFRINYDVDYGKIKEEIESGRLRQGWGACNMDIRNDYNAFSNAWNKAFVNDNSSANYIKNKYNNIKSMLEIKKGDIIIVPKLSISNVEDWWKYFTILECTEGYGFETIVSADGRNDFGHYIGVKILFSCNYDNEETLDISGKFKAYQKAINNVYNKTFCATVNRLIDGYREGKTFMDGKPSLLKAMEKSTSDAKEQYLQSIVNKINDWGPGRLENIICELFEKQGYAVIGKHRYDRKGGDIDIVCNSFVPGSFLADVCTISENDVALPEVRVQAKNKRGKDEGDVEGIRQLKDMPGSENAINILINTTPGFSKDAKELAGKDVILINGKQFASLLLKYGLDPLS